jgi:4'-phosphopantetheinyl transferase
LKKQIICDSLIYEIDLSDIKEDEHDFLLAFLNEEEKNRASRMIRHVAERFVVCRSICKKILSEHLSIDVKNINFDYGKNGKPYLKNEQNLHFNISHSRDMAVLGIRYGSSIGVDVEFIDEKYDIFPLMDLFMYEHEKKWALETNTLNRFFIIWTLKEAIMKKTGTGISEDGFPVITIMDNNIYKCDSETLHCSFISNAGHVISVCL